MNKITCPKCLYQGEAHIESAPMNDDVIFFPLCPKCGTKIEAGLKIEYHICQVPEKLCEQYLRMRGFDGRVFDWTALTLFFERFKDGITEEPVEFKMANGNIPEKFIEAFGIMSEYFGREVE